MDELSATIGRIQLKKLPEILKQRRYIAVKLAEGMKDLKSMTVPPLVPGAESAHWFGRIELDVDKLTCDKVTFCDALNAEGLIIGESYRGAMPHRMDWFKNRKVFGTSGLPWSSPMYKGDPDREFETPNAVAATDAQFVTYTHEGWGDREIADALAIFKKVESAFLK